MKCLIIGGGGAVGVSLLYLFKAMGWQATIVDPVRPKHWSAHEEALRGTVEGWTEQPYSLEHLHARLKREQFDAVIDLAPTFDKRKSVTLCDEAGVSLINSTMVDWREDIHIAAYNFLDNRPQAARRPHIVASGMNPGRSTPWPRTSSAKPSSPTPSCTGNTTTRCRRAASTADPRSRGARASRSRRSSRTGTSRCSKRGPSCSTKTRWTGRSRASPSAASDGTVVEMSVEIEAKDVPEAVMAAIRKAAGGTRITELGKEELHAEPTGSPFARPTNAEVYYWAEFEDGDAAGEASVAPDGAVVEVLKWKTVTETRDEVLKKDRRVKLNRGRSPPPTSQAA